MKRARAGMVSAALVLGSLGIGASPAAAAPSKWDPRVEKYVRFVEKHRKLKFDHPVRVEFLGDAAFVKAFQRDDPEITKKDRAEAARIAGELRAVGLIEGPVDLIQSGRDLGATDTVGFYDQERKELFVRGTDLTDTDVRITLVHELTHALQDQQFNLTKLDDAVDGEGEDFALTALIEGDATSVEDDYLYSLPQDEQDAYFDEVPDATSAPDESTPPDIPPVLDTFTSGPYIFGSRYIEMLRQAGGEGRVDDSFATPPLTEEEIVDPVAARGAQAGRRVPAPKLAADERRRGKANEFGAWSLYLVLASRLDPELSLRAAEGWGGDRYVGFTKQGADDQECLRISIVGDTSTDTGELADAFSQWAALLPAGAATSERVGNRVDVTACDTGATTAADDATLESAVTLLVDRNDIALEMMRAKAPPRIARCAADQLAADPSFVALLDAAEFTPEQESEFSDAVGNAVTNCNAT